MRRLSGLGFLSGLSWRHVGVVARKELLDTLRDRRTWVAMIVMPLVIIPVMLLLAPSAVESQIERIEKTTFRVAVVGDEEAESLVAALEATPGLELVGSGDPEADLGAGRLHAVLYLPPGFDAAVAAERPVQVEVAFDASDQKSQAAEQRLRFAVEAYARAVVERRLAERGLDPGLLTPVVTASRNVAPPAKMGGFFLAMVMPMLIAVWAVTGGMYAAIDGTAGEKERGTMEVLLAAPPSRASIALGKYAVVTLTALLAATVSVAAMLVTFVFRPDALAGWAGGSGAEVALPVGRLGLVAVASLGVAAIFSAIELAVALFARSFREAQSYLAPLAIVVVIPGIVTQLMPAADAATWYFAVPVLNAIFVYKELLQGVVSWAHLGITLGSSLVVALVCLAVTVKLFGREDVLFWS
ncbi:MAG: ABC transporter permease [Firmicutes bacterium]|nr:ABC transporter permease [Bacillota bacterium]